jgi:hypothetical protein
VNTRGGTLLNLPRPNVEPSTETGQLQSSDPLTQDRYALTCGNPLAFIDWSGHMPSLDGSAGSDATPSPMGPDGGPSSQPANVDSGNGGVPLSLLNSLSDIRNDLGNVAPPQAQDLSLPFQSTAKSSLAQSTGATRQIWATCHQRGILLMRR